MMEEFYIQLKDVISLIEDNLVKTANKWDNSVFLDEQLSTYLSEYNYPYLFQVAIEENSCITLKLLLDYYNIPNDNLTFKQRISYYQLLRENSS